MPIIKIKAPAKVNLYLKVLGKRPDGYHNIETVFETLTLCDELTFRIHETQLRLRCNKTSLPVSKKNLVLRAALLLRTRYGVTQGVHIHLNKVIPIAAGLGGGSSDAASTLLALNQLWKLKLSQAHLLKIAAKLGSDVPFFILKSAYALGRGRGERLSSFKSKMKNWHVLVTPRLKILAGHAYGSINSGLLTANQTNAKMLVASVKNKNLNQLKSLLFNTLEQPILDQYPVTRRLKQDLINSGAENAMVSGSGPTVFGITNSQVSAARIASRIKKKHPNKTITIAATLL